MTTEGELRFGPQLRETLTRITEEAARLLAAEGAGLRLVEGEDLVRVATFGPAGGVMARERLRIGESLSGRVAASGEPLLVGDPDTEPTHDPVYRETAERHGFRSWLGVPLRDRERQRVIGVLVMQSRSDQRFGPDDVKHLEAFAGLAAIAVENARLHEARDHALAEVESGRRRLAFLADASERLAGSLDLETTLGSIAGLAVPAVADWCAIDLIEADGRIRRVGIAHADPAKQPLAEQLQRFPPNREGTEGLPRVLRTGESLLYAEQSDATLRAAAHGPEHLAILRALGPKSVIMVPLRARGVILGTILLASSNHVRRYGPEDLRLAEDLARRAATALDNARLYGEARAAIRARDEFLSVAAHELRTPITSLLGFSQLLLRQFDRQPGPDERLVRRALEAVERQSGRLSSLVSQLLDLSRLESGKLVLDRKPTDLTSLVAEVAASIGVSSSSHAIVVQAPPELRALVDPLRLEQVLSNLLDNAIKFSPQGERVELTLGVTPDSCFIAVRDHGIGIPPEAHRQIFDRFYQAHAANSLSGMGLGLYISRQIVELHGGSIRVEAPPDGGTRFVLELPIGPADHAPAAVAEGSA